MKFYIIIPAHNESKTIGLTLNSLVNQTKLPKKLVVVNDSSNDETGQIISFFTEKYDWIKSTTKFSSLKHVPGGKVISAFYKGYELLDEDYDIICKFDADLIFEPNYIESISLHFKSNRTLGIAGGICLIKKDKGWIPEGEIRGDHIRGGIKAYRRDCFIEIGKLKKSIGWDTIDEFLAKYYCWTILVDPKLQVKHLRATGDKYIFGSEKLQGVAAFRMRLGIILTLLSAIKTAIRQNRILPIKTYLVGYFMGKSKKMSFLVNKDQGKFIRQKRWTGIFKNFFRCN